ncbi:hypothetical protein HYC85_016063 [Camellia sinensis]|uniref:Uncharacterized protein n=1 Tax=Camellia sinensis TaxID=4442 RepID=A0A7J7GZW0_CAMSI|nr:hypothetical protein HYC85_016063 [Camellia sinensis]
MYFIHYSISPPSNSIGDLRVVKLSRGCMGCYSKPTPVIAVDAPAKELRIGQRVKKSSAYEDFWSTSTYEMDNNAVHSQRSISSISVSNESLSSGTGISSNHSEFAFFSGIRPGFSGLEIKGLRTMDKSERKEKKRNDYLTYKRKEKKRNYCDFSPSYLDK